MQKVREISRGGGGDGVETEACNLNRNAGSDRQPVKISEYWGDMNMWRCTDYKTGFTVLDSLKFAILLPLLLSHRCHQQSGDM